MEGGIHVAIFLLNSLVAFGIHVFHDLPGPLQGVFQAIPECDVTDDVSSGGNVSCTAGLAFTPFQYNQLYSAYSITEAVVACFAGFLVERLGRTVTLTTGGVLSCIGGIVFAFGPSLVLSVQANLSLMLFGRVLMAISNGCLFVLQGVVIKVWFEANVAFAFGAISSANAAGEVLNFLVTKTLANALGVQWTLWIAAIVVVVGTSLPALLLGYLDSIATNKFEKNIGKAVDNRLHLSDVMTFPAQYWVLAFIRVFNNSMIWSFIGNVSEFVTDKYGYSESSPVPSYFAGIFFGLSTVGCILTGKIMDYFGYRLVITSISLLGTMATLCLTAFTFFPPHICALIIGVFYSFTAVSVIACISLTVSQANVGTAVGIVLALEMAMTAISNMIIGAILGNTHGIPKATMLTRWRIVIIYAIGLTGLALIFSWIANLLDYHMNSKLNKDDPEKSQKLNGFTPVAQDDDGKFE